MGIKWYLIVVLLLICISLITNDVMCLLVISLFSLKRCLSSSFKLSYLYFFSLVIRVLCILDTRPLYVSCFSFASFWIIFVFWQLDYNISSFLSPNLSFLEFLSLLDMYIHILHCIGDWIFWPSFLQIFFLHSHSSPPSPSGHCVYNITLEPLTIWHSWLGAFLCTERLPISFLVRACAGLWAVSPVRGWCSGGSLVFPSHIVFLPLSLPSL